jgi:hypothetical protein
LIISNLLRTNHNQALSLLQGGNEACSLRQGIVRALVQLGVAGAHDFNIQLPQLQLATVDVGNFKLAPADGLMSAAM